MSQEVANLSEDDKIIVEAYGLAVKFCEEKDLPARFRARNENSRLTTPKLDSEIEKRFLLIVASWQEIIVNMFGKLDEDLAWRFLQLRPCVELPLQNVAMNEDFRRFVDYLVRRRDLEGCSPRELGGLAQLSVPFQREVEKQISREPTAIIDRADITT